MPEIMTVEFKCGFFTMLLIPVNDLAIDPKLPIFKTEQVNIGTNGKIMTFKFKNHIIFKYELSF